MTAMRTVLITGAARGIGRAMALHLAAPGVLLLLHYRASQAEARQLAEQATEKGARVELLQADLAQPTQRAEMMEVATSHTDSLNVLINNVGVYEEIPLLELTPAQWSHTLEATCTAVFDLTQRALPLLRKGAPARIVNLGDSGNDRIAARTSATHYHVAKLGVNVLTRSFAKLLTGQGITVNQISPGFLENSQGEPTQPIPAGRSGTCQDILPALDYLLSPQAQYLSGANLVISGGWNL